MTEPVYVARTSIEKVEGVHRRVHLPTGVLADMGVHGAIREHFGLLDAKDLPLPVDYIVGATGA